MKEKKHFHTTVSKNIQVQNIALPEISGKNVSMFCLQDHKSIFWNITH